MRKLKQFIIRFLVYLLSLMGVKVEWQQATAVQPQKAVIPVPVKRKCTVRTYIHREWEHAITDEMAKIQKRVAELHERMNTEKESAEWKKQAAEELRTLGQKFMALRNSPMTKETKCETHSICGGQGLVSPAQAREAMGVSKIHETTETVHYV